MHRHNSKKRATEIGINLNQNRKSCIYREKDVEKADRSQYFRRKVIGLLELQPEMAAKELEEQVLGAYAWFNKNDFKWLKQRLVIDQEKHYWVEWEQEQLAVLKNAYEKIREMGLKPNTYHKYADFIEKMIKELNNV